MRRTLFILLASLLVLSCGRDPGEAAVERDWTRDAVVYELNTRQATGESTAHGPAPPKAPSPQPRGNFLNLRNLGWTLSG